MKLEYKIRAEQLKVDQLERLFLKACEDLQKLHSKTVDKCDECGFGYELNELVFHAHYWYQSPWSGQSGQWHLNDEMFSWLCPNCKNQNRRKVVGFVRQFPYLEKLGHSGISKLFKEVQRYHGK